MSFLRTRSVTPNIPCVNIGRPFSAWQKPGEKLRILAVGCGAGAEVDLLRDAGFKCVGIDNGNRVRSWSTRRSRHSLAMANAMRLPFSAGSFDVAFCGCAFPHVGVVGDSSTPSETCWDDRLTVAREMTRGEAQRAYRRQQPEPVVSS